MGERWRNEGQEGGGVERGRKRLGAEQRCMHTVIIEIK